MSNIDELNLTGERNKGNSVPYLILLSNAEKEKANIRQKRKAANNFVVLSGTVLEMTRQIDAGEFYLAMYNSFVKNGTVKNYEEFLSYGFVHQIEIRKLIDALDFTGRIKGGASE